MGHTLVARFEPNDFDSINGCLIEWKGKTMNKIPFGRNCDREEANRILPFHMTLLHWARSADSYMLQKMSGKVDLISNDGLCVKLFFKKIVS